MPSDLAKGLVHEVPADLHAVLLADEVLREKWQALSAIGRNEFLCWVEDAKTATTRQRRIDRTREELREGKKRPCCWVGCIHRTDKAPGKWAQAVLIDKTPNDKPPAKRSRSK